MQLSGVSMLAAMTVPIRLLALMSIIVVGLMVQPTSSSAFKACLTTLGEWGGETNLLTLQGGLANSVGCINGGAVRGAKWGIPYIFPMLLPRDHDLNHTFVDLFEQDKLEYPVPNTTFKGLPLYTCKGCSQKDYFSLERSIHQYDAKSVPTEYRSGPLAFATLYKHHSQEFRDFVQTHAIDLTVPVAVARRSKQAGCSHLIIAHIAKGFGLCGLSYDYSMTQDIFRQGYRSKPIPPAYVTVWKKAIPEPILVSIHHRLGDISSLPDSNTHTVEKRLRPSYPLVCLLLVLQVLRKDCIQVALISDGSPRDTDILKMLEYFETNDIIYRHPKCEQVPLVERMPLEALPVPQDRFDFDILANSDIMIAASSGFSRLAAVLNTQVNIALETKKHPLEYLDNIVNVPRVDIYSNRKTFDTAVKSSSFDAYVQTAFDKMTASLDYAVMLRRLRSLLKRKLPADVYARCHISNHEEAAGRNRVAEVKALIQGRRWSKLSEHVQQLLLNIADEK
eukprot:m.42667 g.42667  ORF g.42667 m.42667 type:complete len:506 (+) comp12906_c0_seq1:41-1558(+)